jgi:hypothetical protein
MFGWFRMSLGSGVWEKRWGQPLCRWASGGQESWRTKPSEQQEHDTIERVTYTVEPESCSSRDFDTINCEIWPSFCDFRLVWSNKFRPVQHVWIDLWLLLSGWQTYNPKKLDMIDLWSSRFVLIDLGSSRSVLNQIEVLRLKVNLKQSLRMESGLSSLWLVLHRCFLLFSK